MPLNRYPRGAFMRNLGQIDDTFCLKEGCYWFGRCTFSIVDLKAIAWPKVWPKVWSKVWHTDGWTVERNDGNPLSHVVATRHKRGVSRDTTLMVHNRDWVLRQLLTKNWGFICIGSGLTWFLFPPLNYKFKRENLSGPWSRLVAKNIRHKVAQKIGKNHI